MFEFYKLKRNKILAVMLGGILYSSLILAADYSKEVRTAYSDNIKEMCHASVEYDLDMSFEDIKVNDSDYRSEGTENIGSKNGAKVLYNKTMECLFESAFVKATNDINKDFNKIFKNIKFKSPDSIVYKPKDLKMKNINCGEDEIAKIFETQVNNGYKTLCKIDGRKSSVEEVYSACRVAEVAFNEFCAYQEYLLWKQSDESMRIESEKISSKEKFFSKWNNKNIKYNKELNLSYEILLETLEQFHTYVQNYRISLWEKVIDNALIVTRRKLSLIREAIFTWPIKFHNAAIQQ